MRAQLNACVLNLVKEVARKENRSKKKTPPPFPCDELQEFLDHNVDKLVVC